MDPETWRQRLESLKALLLDARVSGGKDDIDSFLPRGRAREVFHSHESVLKDLYEATDTSRRQHKEQSAAFLAAVIGEDDDHALSNILATLLYGPIHPKSESWKRFEGLCEQPVERRRFCDYKLPLSKQDVGEFLGEDNVHRENFSKDQYMFSPPVLKKGDMIDNSTGRTVCCAPYLKEQYLKAGAHGKVYRVTLAGNHFGLASDGRTICARKDYDITNLHTFEAEWKYAKILSESKKRNENILEIFAGLRMSSSLSLFCELADCDLGDFMNKAGRPSGPANINHRLIQFRGIVHAVEFLHTEVKSRTGTRESCFHLDLKPKNILVFNEGTKEEIFKICDFSISRSKNQRLVLELQKSVRDMSTAAALGDANICLAPEAFGDGRVNASNDIWHLGCVLCMFTAWLYGGPKGLQDFDKARYSIDQSADWFFSSLELDNRPSDNETEYWREAPKQQKFFIFRLSIEVGKWLDLLLELTKCGPEAAIYSALAQVLKEQLLVADPQKREKIENVRHRLDSVIGQFGSRQNRTDVSLKAPSPGRLSTSARPVLKK